MIVSRMSAWFAFGMSLVNIPTLVTLVRIVCIPWIVACMMTNHWLSASIFFIIASVSDLIDGALARYLRQETFFGSYLDPIADKLLLISSFTGFALYYKASAIPLWFLAFIIVSELVLVALAFYWGVFKRTMVIKPTRLGKLTSFGQVLVLGWLFWCSVTRVLPGRIFWLLLGLVVVSRLCTYIDYAIIFFKKESVSR